MFFYILVLILLVIAGLFEIITENKKIAVGAGSLLALIAGLRYNTGFDFITYREYYYQVQTWQDVLENTVFEPGYLLLSLGFSRAGFTYPTFVLFFSLISLGILTYFLIRHFPYPTLALTYYYARFFHLRDMAQVRSALASIILLFAIPYLLEDKFWKFMLVIFIAMMFHSGSFVFLLVYPLHRLVKKLNAQNIFILFGLSILIGLVVQYPDLYAWAVPARYISYITAPSRMGGPWYFNPIVWMQIFIFSTTAYLVRTDDRQEEAKLDLWLKIYFVATLALIATNTMRVLGGRISTFMATVEILIVPYLIFHLTKNKALNIMAYFGFAAFVFVLIFIISGRYLPYVPYRTLFNY